MLQSTASEIITAGLTLAGRDELTALALTWLNRWLDAVAAGWDWPVLRREAYIKLPDDGSAVDGVDVGTGMVNGRGVLEGVLKIYQPISLFDANNNKISELTLVDNRSAPTDIVYPSTRPAGYPTEVRLRKQYGTPVNPIYDNYAYSMVFNRWPTAVCYVHFPYKSLPVSIIDPVTERPWYPNIETMVQLVRYKALDYADPTGEQTIAAQQQLSGLITNDRVRYGQMDDESDGGLLTMLNPKVFKMPWRR